MRLFLAGFLMTGLFLIGLSVYERNEATEQGEVIAPVTASDDGTGFPSPNTAPTPRPKLTK